MAATLFTVAVLFALGIVYWFPIRSGIRRWGSTEADLTRRMIGDAVVPEPSSETTLAITVDAAPEDIWPWLLQLGYRRGGLYSYDWLDQLFGYLDAPSVERILPEFQRLSVGDVIPIGRGKGFPVTAIEPYRALVLSGDEAGVTWTWQFGLSPLDASHTRLASRNRIRTPGTVGSMLMMTLIEPAAFIMTRRMLIGLKRRAELLASARREASRPAA